MHGRKKASFANNTGHSGPHETRTKGDATITTITEPSEAYNHFLGNYALCDPGKQPLFVEYIEMGTSSYLNET